MNNIFLFFFFIISFLLEAIDLNLPVSASQNAANNLILLSENPATACRNPAIISSGIETSVSYLFNLSELPYYNLHIAHNFSKFSLFSSFSYLGKGDYLESNTLLGANYKIKDINFGINTRFLKNKVNDYHEFSKILFDAGLFYKFSSVSVSFSAKNITQAYYLGEKLPVFMFWESAWHPSVDSVITFGLEKQEGYDFIFKIASKYKIYQILSLICSYQHDPVRFAGGFEIKIHKWKVVYSVRTHQFLPLTHYVSLVYSYQG